jgi:hypothetical protein
MLRRLGCTLPIQVWHLGSEELDERMQTLMAPLGVECVDAYEVRKRLPIRILKGWELKPYAILHSRFREVLFLDADNVPVVNPEFLFDTPQFRKTGAIFWPDYGQGQNEKAAAIWRSCGLRQPKEPEFESGQIVLDKQRCWRALCLTLWFNEHSDFYYTYVHGDKETFHLAFRKLRKNYSLIPTPIHPLKGTMCQHDFDGRRIFQHRNCDKWDLLMCNRKVRGFLFEKECRDYVAELGQTWDCGMGRIFQGRPSPRPRLLTRQPKIEAVMISCPEREQVRGQTLANLGRTDWGDLPLRIQIDEGLGANHQQRQTRCAFLALRAALHSTVDYVLFLEDDLDFNRHLRHNLQQWAPVKTRTATLASLYNPRIREIACDPATNTRVVSPKSVYGSQALLISLSTLKYVMTHWNSCRGMQDIRISRLAGRLSRPILYHAPSLVQHVGRPSIWGARFHQASDFDSDWRA